MQSPGLGTLYTNDSSSHTALCVSRRKDLPPATLLPSCPLHERRLCPPMDMSSTPNSRRVRKRAPNAYATCLVWFPHL